MKILHTLLSGAHRRNAAWSPASVPGLVLAVDAGEVLGAEGSEVGLVPAAFGTTYSLSQPVSANRPLLRLAAVNGHNAIHSDGANDVLSTPGDVPELASLTGLTVFAVVNPLSSPPSYGHIAGQYSYPSGPFMLYNGASGTGAHGARLNSGSAAGTLGSFGSASGQGYGTFRLLMLKFESNSVTIVKNKSTTIVGPSAYTGPLYDNTIPFSVGGNIGGNYWSGMWAMILVYDRALDAAGIGEVADYLLDRYAL